MYSGKKQQQIIDMMPPELLAAAGGGDGFKLEFALIILVLLLHMLSFEHIDFSILIFIARLSFEFPIVTFPTPCT